MFPSEFAKAIPLDYGKLGAPYLRRAAVLVQRSCRCSSSTRTPDAGQGDPANDGTCGVSLGGERGAAFIRFGPLHERFIVVQRENNTWTIAGVLDGELNQRAGHQ